MNLVISLDSYLELEKIAEKVFSFKRFYDRKRFYFSS